MRCPDCNKFVAYDDSTEPEASLEASADGTGVSGDVRVLLTCAECGCELKENRFDIDETVEIPEGHVCHHAEIVACPPHVEHQPCTVCGWNGEVKARPDWWYPEKITRYNPPKAFAQAGGGTMDFIGAVGHTYFSVGEEAEFERRVAQAELSNRGIPRENPGRAAYDEEPTFEVEVSSVELTSRADCGVNKRTGKPNKYNPRFATTYYGFELHGEVKCGCGQIAVEFSVSDETSASSMDELV